MQTHRKVMTKPTEAATTNSSTIDYHFVDFDVIREDWNKYKLEDGTIIKTKFVLINVMVEKTLKELISEAKAKKKKGSKQLMGIAIQSKNVVGVEAPKKLKGAPSSQYTPQELQASIIHKDVDFEVIKERRNEYKLKNGMIIKVRASPFAISKTSKFDSQGLPIYSVNSTADVIFVFPEELERESKLVEKKPHGK